MARMSNRDRIARAAEEAKAGAAEKAAKKATKKPAGSRATRTAVPVRMKVIWEVCNVAGTAVKSFPYPDRAAAEAETESLSRSTGRTHILRPTKVPMDDGE